MDISKADSPAEFTEALVPYDENLLERSRTQWQFGDWHSLASLDRETLQHHPDRAKLALLAAAGHQQAGHTASARQFTRLAMEWGCNKRLVCQILISGVYNTLCVASILGNQPRRAARHQIHSISVGAPTSDIRLIVEGRISYLDRGESLTKARQILREVSSKLTQEWIVLAGRGGDHEVLTAVNSAIAADDLHEAVDRDLKRLTPDQRVAYCMDIAAALSAKGDNLSSLHFLRLPLELGWQMSTASRARIVIKLAEIGRGDLAANYVVSEAISSKELTHLPSHIRKGVQQHFDSLVSKSQKQGKHGHDLLIDHLRKAAGSRQGGSALRRPVLIEVGSTRELVPGQGSTRELAELCRSLGLRFITVDMDPQNTRLAREVFASIGVDFEAITDKGEDFLQRFDGEIDFVFLDAYDFDHGNHSALRQARYRKFLGSEIAETECHAMHLKCAQQLVMKLAANGVICFDDTWIDDGHWTAKGTTAVPYLLENGFEVIEARNRAVLLKRTKAQ